METIGDVLTTWVKAQSGLITPMELGRIIGLTSSGINKLLKGPAPKPDVETLQKIYWKTKEYNLKRPPQLYSFGEGVLGIPWDRLAALRPDLTLPDPDFWTYLENFSATLSSDDRATFLRVLEDARVRYEACLPAVPVKKMKTG